MKVKNKTIVVTGAGNGIGREMTLALLRRGARVAAVDLRPESLQQTAALASTTASQLSTHVLNITDRTAVETLPDQVQSRHGSVDGLINNAGIIQPFVRIRDLELEAIDRVIAVNLMGTIWMTKAFLPHLLHRPEAHIANISSMGGFLPVPGQTIYGASKAAVKLFTEGLHSELRDTRVGVTVVFPGAIGTQIAQNSGVADSLDIAGQMEKSPIKMLAPERAAHMILDAIERNRYSVFVGSDSAILDKLYRLYPQGAARLIYRQMRSLLPK